MWSSSNSLSHPYPKVFYFTQYNMALPNLIQPCPSSPKFNLPHPHQKQYQPHPTSFNQIQFRLFMSVGLFQFSSPSPAMKITINKYNTQDCKTLNSEICDIFSFKIPIPNSQFRIQIPNSNSNSQFKFQIPISNSKLQFPIQIPNYNSQFKFPIQIQIPNPK